MQIRVRWDGFAFKEEANLHPRRMEWHAPSRHVQQPPGNQAEKRGTKAGNSVWLNCVPKTQVEVLTPAPQNAAALGNGVVTEIKRRSVGWALSQHGQCPGKEIRAQTQGMT